MMILFVSGFPEGWWCGFPKGYPSGFPKEWRLSRLADLSSKRWMEDEFVRRRSAGALFDRNESLIPEFMHICSGLSCTDAYLAGKRWDRGIAVSVFAGVTSKPAVDHFRAKRYSPITHKRFWNVYAREKLIRVEGFPNVKCRNPLFKRRDLLSGGMRASSRLLWEGLCYGKAVATKDRSRWRFQEDFCGHALPPRCHVAGLRRVFARSSRTRTTQSQTLRLN